MRVDSNWSFRDLVNNIRRLKKEYIFYLAFFSCDDSLETKRLYNLYIKTIRDLFYDIQIDERKIDIAWEYMNDYVTYQELFYYLSRLDRNKKR